MSCQEDGVDGYNYDTEFRFEVYNTNSISLLDPTNPSAFQESQIDIYYLVDGEKQKVYNGNLDLPENFSIEVDELTDKYVMVLSPNDEADGSTSATYIQWNEENTDTVTCEFARGKEHMITTQIAYNGKEVWSVDGENYPERRYFEIIK